MHGQWHTSRLIPLDEKQPIYSQPQADRVTDVGVYQCVAENSLGSVLSNKVFLSIACKYFK